MSSTRCYAASPRSPFAVRQVQTRVRRELEPVQDGDLLRHFHNLILVIAVTGLLVTLLGIVNPYWRILILVGIFVWYFRPIIKALAFQFLLVRKRIIRVPDGLVNQLQYQLAQHRSCRLPGDVVSNHFELMLFMKRAEADCDAERFFEYCVGAATYMVCARELGNEREREVLARLYRTLHDYRSSSRPGRSTGSW